MRFPDMPRAALLLTAAVSSLLLSCHFDARTPTSPQAPNGIYVGEPKVSDDASLQVLLHNTMTRVSTAVLHSGSEMTNAQ